MVDQTLVSDIPALDSLYPEKVMLDNRPGYSGFIVPRDYLIEIAKEVHDVWGYDMLSSLTGVDYFPETMEVVYHLYRSLGGGSLVLKVQVPRGDAVLPSLYSIFNGAEFQEREAWDLLGIKFENHPDLRRILMWEGFAGFPLRKDWKEPYYEEESKPFSSRWPEGVAEHAENNNIFGANVKIS